MDYWITRRISLRTQGDYFLTQPDGTFGFHLQNNFRIVGGIVFTFGSTPTMTASMTRPHVPPSHRQNRQDVIAKQTPQTAAPAVVTTATAPAQSEAQRPTQPAPVTPMGAIQSSTVVAKQTSAPAPVPAAVLAPRQDPFTLPAKPASSVVNTSPAPAPVTTAVVRPPAPARAAAAPQPEEQFSLGEYARRLREKKESQPKDWN